jgi:hypothetical protein
MDTPLNVYGFWEAVLGAFLIAYRTVHSALADANGVVQINLALPANRAYDFLGQLLVIETRNGTSDYQPVLARIHTQFPQLADWTVTEGSLSPGLKRIENGYVGQQHMTPFVHSYLAFRQTASQASDTCPRNQNCAASSLTVGAVIRPEKPEPCGRRNLTDFALSKARTAH